MSGTALPPPPPPSADITARSGAAGGDEAAAAAPEPLGAALFAVVGGNAIGSSRRPLHGPPRWPQAAALPLS